MRCAATLVLLGFVTSSIPSSASDRIPQQSASRTLFACSLARDSVAWPTLESARRGLAPQARLEDRVPRKMVLNLSSTGTMTWVIWFKGRPATALALTDLEQTNSPGSGAGGRADTIVRGKSGRAVLTLFVSYSSAEALFAALRVDSGSRTLLTCDDGGYSAPVAKGGSHLTTSIFGLHYDDLARAMTDEPEWPDTPPP